jgi:hypothetical protein
MGRSGSSAFARILALCGGALPRELLPPNFANPRGYWEPLRALELNDAFLGAHQSSWYDGSLALQSGRVGAAERVAFVDAIVRFFETEYGAARTAVVKEPRITALLPYWIEGARRAGRGAKFVHVWRDPAPVAASLADRDGVGADHAFALWLKYNLIAERDTRGSPRVLAAFDELLGDWETVAAKCIGQLGLHASVDDRAREAVAGFLVPDLRHHRGAASCGALRIARLEEWVARTLAALRAAGGPDAARLDAILEEYAGSRVPLEFRLKSPIAARVPAG